MAIIYLKHETHGTKVATLEQEAAYDESHGWTRYTVDDFLPDDETENAMPKPRRKRSAAVES